MCVLDSGTFVCVCSLNDWLNCACMKKMKKIVMRGRGWRAMYKYL